MKRKDEGAFTVNVIVNSIREKLNQAGKSIKITLFLHYFSLSDPDFDDVEDDGTFGSLPDDEGVPNSGKLSKHSRKKFKFCCNFVPRFQMESAVFLL